jgi:hypothetical protein
MVKYRAWPQDVKAKTGNFSITAGRTAPVGRRAMVA